MILSGVLALLIASSSAAYPLGPFAHVSWQQVFHRTASFKSQTIQGIAYDTFLHGPDRPGGTPAFDEVAVGQVGPRKTWVAAIPLESGGSGQVFTTAVFRLDGKSARYVDSISVGDRAAVQVYDGTIHVTAPAPRGHEPDCCTTHIHVFDYVVDQDRLRKVSEAIVQTQPYFRKHFRRYYIAGEIETISKIGKTRVVHARATVRGVTRVGTYGVAGGVDLTGVSPTKKLLLVCQVDESPDAKTTWIITAIYPYLGGLK